jgi:hypothetical protein
MLCVCNGNFLWLSTRRHIPEAINLGNFVGPGIGVTSPVCLGPGHNMKESGDATTWPSSEPPGLHESEIVENEVDGEDDASWSESADHDQLPSVEEARANYALSGAHRKHKKYHFRRITFFLVIGGIALCLVVTLSFAMKARNDGTREGADSLSQQKTANPVIAPTEAPDLDLPADESADVFRISESIVTLEWSTREDVTREGSPQREAIRWLANKDDMKVHLDVANVERFRERYAVAVLYFAWGGDAWTYQANFLNHTTEACDWNIPFEGVNGARYKFGIGCIPGGNSDYINRIFLPLNNLAGVIPPEFGLLSALETVVCKCCFGPASRH